MTLWQAGNFLIEFPQLARYNVDFCFLRPGFEFFYAQSPYTMRGMMIGLFFFVLGFSSFLATAVLYIFSQKQWMGELDIKNSNESCGFWYYLIFLIVAVVTSFLYVCIARWYKNRERGELDESELFYRQT